MDSSPSNSRRRRRSSSNPSNRLPLRRSVRVSSLPQQERRPRLRRPLPVVTPSTAPMAALRDQLELQQQLRCLPLRRLTAAGRRRRGRTLAVVVLVTNQEVATTLPETAPRKTIAMTPPLPQHQVALPTPRRLPTRSRPLPQPTLLDKPRQRRRPSRLPCPRRPTPQPQLLMPPVLQRLRLVRPPHRYTRSPEQ